MAERMAMADEAAMVGLIHAAIAQAGSRKVFAGTVGVSEQFLCDVLKGRRAAGPRLAAHFGYVPVTRYLAHSAAPEGGPAPASPEDQP